MSVFEKLKCQIFFSDNLFTQQIYVNGFAIYFSVQIMTLFFSESK